MVVDAFAEPILALAQVASLLFVVGSMLAMGLGLTIPAITGSLRDRRMLGLAVVANFVVVPAIAWGGAQLIADDHVGLQTGLILVGAVAGAPFLPKLAELARGDVALSVGLMVVLMVLTIPYAPLVLPLLLEGVTVDALQIASSLVFLMLGPLSLGLGVRARYPGAAETIRPIAGQVSSVALALLAVSLLVVNFDGLVSTIGTGGLLAALVLLAGAFLVGLAIGTDRRSRSVLALGTGQRNLAAALVIATQNFADDPEVITMIMVVSVIGLVALFGAAGEFSRRAQRSVPAPVATPEEARRIAEEAYVYAFPMLEFLRTMRAMAVDERSPGFRAPMNQFWHATELLDATFTQIVSPNNDTLYSMAFLDLRAQPMLLQLPLIGQDRYRSFQLVDQHTHNVGYIGTRTTGNGAGTYLIAGPDWGDGVQPDHVDDVFRCESDFVFLIGRTQIDGPHELPQVREMMASYALVPLSARMPALKPPNLAALKPGDIPATDAESTTTHRFIAPLNWLLGHVEPHPDDAELLGWLERIGIAPGAPFHADTFPAELRAAIDAGVDAARDRIEQAMREVGEIQDGWQVSRDAFGDRKRMQDRWLVRAAAASLGLYGNDAEEAMYPVAHTDAAGRPLDGRRHEYELRFPQQPPVGAFWSLTMYRLPGQTFVANDEERYSIGDRSPDLRRAADGSVTIRLSTSPPDREEINWLPAPAGPFYVILRLYLPGREILDGRWQPPPIARLVDLAGEEGRATAAPARRPLAAPEPDASATSP